LTNKQTDTHHTHPKTDTTENNTTFQHGQQHDHHVLLQFHELAQQLQLLWVLQTFVQISLQL